MEKHKWKRGKRNKSSSADLGPQTKSYLEKRKKIKKRADSYIKYKEKGKLLAERFGGSGIGIHRFLSVLNDVCKTLKGKEYEAKSSRFQDIDSGVQECIYGANSETAYQENKEEIDDLLNLFIYEFDQWIIEKHSAEDYWYFCKILDLKPKTKSALKIIIPNFEWALQKAKKKLRISEMAHDQDKARLIQLIQDQLEPYSQLYGEICSFIDLDEYFNEEEPEDDDIFDFFFNEDLDSFQYKNKCKRIKNKAINELQEELTNRINQLEKFKEKSYNGYPKKWMTNDKQIRTNLDKKGNCRFYELFEWLLDNRMKYSDTSDVSEAKGWDQNLVLIVVDRDSVAKKLNVNKQSLHNYLKEMERWKIIKKLGKESENGPNVYAIGKWVKGKAPFPKPVPWLKNSKSMKTALRNFSVNQPQKSNK